MSSNDGNSTSDIENSKLVVMFGNNPAETRMSGGGITWFLEQARERSNARMIVIDPRYTDTAAGREDEWIPIRPGTDAALVAGIAWVLINENLVDQPFLDNYCIGYDEKTLPADAPPNGHYKAYILGQGEDGIAKTPQWASHITGIPADRIIKLAREIGSVKPAYICQGWGPQRQANGEQTARAIAMLPILTGNVGIHGGNSGARESTYTITIERLPVLENPVKTAISCFSWTDAIARGPEMTALRDGVRGKDKLDVPIKFLWNYAGNTERFAYYLSISCNHCEDPACTKVCPSGAMHKRDDGFVVVNEEVCIGCRYCHMACPYGAPQYNAAKGHMTKCDGCYDRVAEGKKPICVESCPLRALDFGPIDELRKKHGELAAVAPLRGIRWEVDGMNGR